MSEPVGNPEDRFSHDAAQLGPKLISASNLAHCTVIHSGLDYLLYLYWVSWCTSSIRAILKCSGLVIHSGLDYLLYLYWSSWCTTSIRASRKCSGLVIHSGLDYLLYLYWVGLWFKQYLLISMIHIVNGIIQRYIGSDSKR